MKAKYLDRSIHTLACHLVLVTTEKDFQRELKRLKVPRDDWPKFLSENAMACVDYLESSSGRQIALVSASRLQLGDGFDNIDIAKWLAHEAVHVWQFHVELIGERKSSKEFEAYGIQHIFENLMREYARQVA